MRYHKNIKKILLLSLTPLVVIVCVLSYLQITKREVLAYSIANNIFICVFTGVIIALIQAIVGYATAKYDCILAFYKNAIMLEDKIIHYPYSRSGFIEAHSGLKDVREITSFFSEQLEFSYRLIEFPKKGNVLFQAIKAMYLSYSKHIKAYQEFDSDLCDAIRFAEVSEETLAEEGITDIKAENELINRKLQAKAEQICDIFNDEEEQRIRVAAYEVIEHYLFKQKVRNK